MHATSAWQSSSQPTLSSSQTASRAQLRHSMQFSQVSHRVTAQRSPVAAAPSLSSEDPDTPVDVDAPVVVVVDVDVDVVVDVDVDVVVDVVVVDPPSPPVDDPRVPTSDIAVSEKHPIPHATTSATPPPRHVPTPAT
jgi:hypothetical protein